LLWKLKFVFKTTGAIKGKKKSLAPMVFFFFFFWKIF